MAEAKRLGLIVNPVAGIGGRVGLKGSDGAEIQKRAREMGAIPQAQERTRRALERVRKVEDISLLTYPGEMGEDAARACGFDPVVLGSIEADQTTARDTRRAAAEMQEAGIDLLLFAGGDGTARDIHKAVGLDLPVLGIPAGVKIHSAVYAANPASAGSLAALFLEGRVAGLREAEVMDINEAAVRKGFVSAQLYGYLKIPYRANLVQNLKVASASEPASLAEIAFDVTEKMAEDCLYIIGPGTTTRAITAELGLPKTLIGVDVILDKEMLAADANEVQLLELMADCQAKIVVTPIGGQGYIFGRGNQQISPKVIAQVMTGKDPWAHIIVVSTPDKLHALAGRPLLVDTGDPKLDQQLSGYVQVVTGYNERAVRKVTA